MLIESISGIRATIGDSMTPKEVVEYASAFGQWVGKGTIILGRDSRVSGKAIANIFARTLQWMGLNVIDIGIVHTHRSAVDRINGSTGRNRHYGFP